LVAYSLDHLFDRFPRLKCEAHEITSEPAHYNCVAFAEGRTDQWIDPDGHWPEGVKRPAPDEDRDMPCYQELFEHYGYEVCSAPDLEDGYIKVALYAHDGSFVHVAVQMPSGRWRSKAGFLHDLFHDRLAALEDCGLAQKAKAVLFMRRPRTAEAKDQEWPVLLLPVDSR
jgi:hypothetical protein